MNNVFRRSIPVLMATVFGTGVIAIAGTAGAQNQGDPPARVGRLAYEEGTVSFHDGQDNNWTEASVNDALTTGDSLWTEPNARGEVSVAGSRVRLDQSTQLDMLKIDDSQTRMQLDQGRLDIKTFSMDNSQPYEVVTPRGTVKLEAQGDYYVESGTTSDPTRLGVRSGAAQITGANGQVLAVRAGEIGEITGDAQSPQLRTIQSAPPPMPQYWAQRDQQISYDAPQYLSADVVGYEDMQAYGAWSNDPDYGQVWSPNNVPDGWQPYSTGEWAYSEPYGWTWVDEQPWGFAPYHYGRWANRNNRWYWVPPERRDHAVYAPALVAFVGGAELGVAIGNAGAGPVGWFPLGPREAYVPPYSHDRAYYDRLNADAHVDRAAMDDRWQHAERHEALTANDPNDRMANRRFTTVMPAAAFVGSQKVERSAIKVSADKLASAPVSAVAAPPAPAQGNEPRVNTRFEGVQALGRPTPAQHPQGQHAPGPAIAAHAQQPNAAQPNHPAEPNNRPAEANRVEPNRAEPARPGEAPRPPEAQAHQAEGPQAHPGEAPRPPQPAAQAQHPEPQHQAEPQRQAAEPQRAPEQHEAPRPAETHAAPPPVQHAEPQHVEAPVQHAAPPSQEAHAPAPAPHPAAPAPAPHPAEPAPAPHPAPAAHPEEKK